MFAYHGPGQHWMSEQAKGMNRDQGNLRRDLALSLVRQQKKANAESQRNWIHILECYYVGNWLPCFAPSRQWHKVIIEAQLYLKHRLSPKLLPVRRVSSSCHVWPQWEKSIQSHRDLMCEDGGITRRTPTHTEEKGWGERQEGLCKWAECKGNL